MANIISITIRESATGLGLQGTVHVDVVVSPAPLRVEFYLDNALLYSTASSSASTYTWTWDTTREANGTHVVRAEAVYKSRRSKAQIATSTNNTTSVPNSFGISLFGQGVFAPLTVMSLRLRYRIARLFGRTPNE